MRRAFPRWAVVLVAALPLGAEERFSPPEFRQHRLPDLMAELARDWPAGGWWAWLDIGLLALALILSAWFGLRRRSRRGLFWLSLGCLAWFGFIKQGCLCPVGALQNVAAAAGGEALGWPSALVFVLPLAAALLAGRVFCAGPCALGAIQDLVLVRPLRLPPLLAGLLESLAPAWLALAALSAFLGGRFLVCEWDPFVGIFRFGAPGHLLVLGGAFLLLGTVVARPYCRFLCPYGVLLRWSSRFAAWRVRVAPGRCTDCRLCERSCPFGAIQAPGRTAEPLARSRRRLLLLLVVLPLAVALGSFLGERSGEALARLDDRVELAALVAAGAEDDAVRVFLQRGGDPVSLAVEAGALRGRWRLGAGIAGGLLALALMARLLRLSRLPRGEGYTAEPGRCLSCARCYGDCPEGRPAPDGVIPAVDGRPWRRSAWIAGFLAVIVLAGLAVLHGAQRGEDLLADRQVPAMKEELRRSWSPELAERLRQVDAGLRTRHFARAEALALGGLLLLAAGAGTILLLRLARRREHAVFDPLRFEKPDPLRQMARERWGLAAGAGLLAGGLALLPLLPGVPLAEPAQNPPNLSPGAEATCSWESAWPGFRGPDGNGLALAAHLPASLDAAAARWSVEVPLPGHGSPVVWGSRIYLSGSDGRRQEVYAVEDGRLLWRCPVPLAAPPVEVFADTGHAAPTPVCDGERVVALFVSGDLVCCDRQGRLLWRRALGPPESLYGLAASPVLWRGTVIVQYDSDAEGASCLAAFRLADGTPAWRTPRETGSTWSSPVIARTAEGGRLLTCGPNHFTVYDPEDGRELGSADLLHGDIGPSPTWHGGSAVLAQDGVCAGLLPIALSGAGGGELLRWKHEDGLPDLVSPLCDGRRVWLVSPGGIVTCLDAADGRELWKHELEKGCIASPLRLGGQLLFIEKDGQAWSQPAEDDQPRFTRLGSLGEPVGASPAAAGGMLFIRGVRRLFCFAGAP